jgi:hypothetical protein
MITPPRFTFLIMLQGPDAPLVLFGVDDHVRLDVEGRGLSRVFVKAFLDQGVQKRAGRSPLYKPFPLTLTGYQSALLNALFMTSLTQTLKLRAAIQLTAQSTEAVAVPTTWPARLRR